MNKVTGINPCPDSILIFGGGRWSRILTEAVYEIVAPTIEINIYSPRNSKLMSEWLFEKGYSKRVRVSHTPPRFESKKKYAVIVANAARDHAVSVEMALNAGAPVLVEKPVTLSTFATQNLINMAHDKDVRLAAANIFLFTKWLENLTNYVSKVKEIRSIQVDWMDPKTEERYGEQKRYDPGLPIHMDILPHVISILGNLKPFSKGNCINLELLKGGAQIKLDMVFDDVPCIINLARNSSSRRRIIKLETDISSLELDFSGDMASLTVDSNANSNGFDWNEIPRPSIIMLSAFLKWAANGKYDQRLDIQNGLRANQIIDQTSLIYNDELKKWLFNKLNRLENIDDDLNYTLREILQSDANMSEEDIQKRIECILNYFTCSEADVNFKKMKDEENPFALLRTIS